MSARGGRETERDPGRESALRAPETAARTPAGERRPLRDARDDTRAELRDPTRSKERRKLTVAQREARERGSGRLARAAGSAKERRHETVERPLGRDRVSASLRATERVREAEPRPRNARALPKDAFERETYPYEGRNVSFTRAQAAAIRDIGRFRVVREDALVRHGFGGDQRECRAQLAELRAGRLVHETQDKYLTLTKSGETLAKALCADERQEVYSGIKRPRELRHDSAVYDAYQHARQGLEASGNRVTVVRLDYEMKGDVAREAYISAAKELRAAGKDIQQLPPDERRDAIKHAAVPVAASRDLPADEDGVDYPDLQIEYERPDGSVGRCNVEVVTENYHEATVAAKHAAGFELYMPADSSGARGGGGVPVHSLADELLEF
jgi:hypothetical protein